MLKLKLQYFRYLMRRTDSLEKTLMLGEIGGRRRTGDRGWDGWIASWTLWTWVCVNSWRWWWTGRPCVLRFMGSQRVGHDWATELHWTALNWTEWHVYHGKFCGFYSLTMNLHMFIHIQMFELYFLINYEFPNKFPSTRKLRADLIPYFNLLGKDKKIQRVEREKATQQVDRSWQMS